MKQTTGKGLALLLAALLLLGLCACGSKAEDAGYYTVYSIQQGSDDTMELADLKSAGLDTIYLYLDKDGTGQFAYDESDVTDLTWKAGTFTIEGEDVPYSLKDGKLSFTTDDLTMVLQKSGDKLPSGGKSAISLPSASSSSSEAASASASASASSSGSGKISLSQKSAEFEPVDGTVGDFGISVLGAEAFTDGDGKDAIRIYYTFTNNSDTMTSAWSSLMLGAAQDGYTLVETYASSEDDAPEYGNNSTDIRPGVTIPCEAEFQYKPSGGKVVFTVSEYDSEESMEAELDPQALTGRPADMPELEKVPNPSWVADCETEGTYQDDFYISITGYEIVDGYDGKVLRVYLDFTNNSKEATSFLMSAAYRAVQDGAALPYDFPEDGVAEDDNSSVDVAPGDTLTIAFCFGLRSDSPVEFEVYDGMTGVPAIGGIITLDD